MIRRYCYLHRAAMLSGLLGLTAFLGGGRASADFIFSNLGPGGSFSTTSYATADNLPTSNNWLAYAFTPTTSSLVTQIDIAVGQGSFNSTTGYAYLMSDNGGVPGSVLMSGPNSVSWSFAIPTTPTLLSLDVPNIYPYPQLTAGQQYWLALAPEVTPDSYYLWYGNSTNQTGPWAQTVNGSWRTTQNVPEGAFAVVGTEISSVPEPATLLLLGQGAAALLGLAWRSHRRGKRQADRLEPVM
jgi:hypothetical protein